MKRVFRKVISAEPAQYGRYDFGLECGHRLKFERVGKTVPKRKACSSCQRIQRFAEESPKLYRTFVLLLHKVPMDDRAEVLLDWITQEHLANEMYRLIPGICPRAAFALIDYPCSYPLVDYWFNDDDDDEEHQHA